MICVRSLELVLGGQPLADGVVVGALVAPKPEWQALLESRGKAKAAPPHLDRFTVSWGSGRLATTDTVRLVRVYFGGLGGVRLEGELDVALVELGVKQMGSKTQLALVLLSTGAHVVAVVPDAGGPGAVVVGPEGHSVPLHAISQDLNWDQALAATEQDTSAVLAECVTGHDVRTADLALVAKIAKAVKGTKVRCTAAKDTSKPHRWDITTEVAEWSVQAMSAV